LSLPQIPQPDVFRAVVVRIEFVPTFEAPELLAVAVVFVGKPTVGVRTPLAGVTGGNLFNRDTPLWRLVFDVLDKTAKCPDMMPVSVWGSRSRMSVRSSNTTTSQPYSMASVTMSLATVWMYMYCFRHARSRFTTRSKAL
jgi:hypothetical protein